MLDAYQLATRGFAGHDAIALDLIERYFLHSQNRTALLGIGLNHLGQDGRACVDHQIVGQQYRKRLVAHQRLGTQHRVAQTQHAVLPHISANHVVGLHRTNQGQQFVLVRCLEFAFEFVGGVKVVFDGPLAATRDKDHVPHTCRVGFFHRVLNQRFVHDRQHLFGGSFGGGQKAGAEARDGEHGFADDVVAHGRFLVQAGF